MTDTSTLARQLRELIYDRILSQRATEGDRRRADEIATLLALPLPSAARSLLDLERIGKLCFHRLDSADAALDYASAEHALKNNKDKG